MFVSVTVSIQHGRRTKLPSIPTARDSGESFLDSQPWVSTGGPFNFVDETRDTIAIHGTNVCNTVSTNRHSTYIPVRPDGDIAAARLPRSQRSIALESHEQRFQQSGNHINNLHAKSTEEDNADNADYVDEDVGIRHGADNETTSRLNVDIQSENLFIEIDAVDKPYGVESHRRRRNTIDVSSHCDVTPSSCSLYAPSSVPGFGDHETPSPSHSLLLGPSIGVGIAAAETVSIGHGRETSSTTYSFSTSIPCPHTEVGLLTDPHEARLLRHFANHLAISFDLTDSSCHFRNVVPQRAMNDPILMNAILAASARHLSRISGGDPYIADKYHQKCIQHLIPMLNDEAAVLDENLLASTVILRFLEEIDVPLSGKLHSDGAGHLIGAHAFISAQEISAVSGGLRLAAFWVGLRQEIYVAFVNQRSMILPLQHCNVDRSFGAADEGTWANRIIVHCAETIQWCFGLREHERSTAQFEELLRYAGDWLKLKPSCYTPIYYRNADADSNAVFPEVVYLSDAAVTGIQHYHLTLILLRAYDPTIPKLGARRATALREMDNEIRYHTKMLCGLALSNSSTPPNFVTASMAVTMAGDKFIDAKEQEACIRILEICEVEHGWSTITAQEDLKEAWGWS
ncbi:hypothetical protein E4T44_01332 [Aureobasidium sp. EXF-8845]|nr:hypothetical protein E4T44_01332 [Aureobasidium sp. EXF-8845]KAI4857447.1 hypothetical protein E4T45_01061 [Aureobasidium sp. EXF-8846]